MGDRYVVSVRCECGFADDAPYAPTSGFLDWKCPRCGRVIDLETYTGIDAESTATTPDGIHGGPPMSAEQTTGAGREADEVRRARAFVVDAATMLSRQHFEDALDAFERGVEARQQDLVDGYAADYDHEQDAHARWKARAEAAETELAAIHATYRPLLEAAREVVNGQRFFGNVTIGDVNHLAAALAALPGQAGEEAP